MHIKSKSIQQQHRALHRWALGVFIYIQFRCVTIKRRVYWPNVHVMMSDRFQSFVRGHARSFTYSSLLLRFVIFWTMQMEYTYVFTCAQRTCARTWPTEKLLLNFNEKNLQRNTFRIVSIVFNSNINLAWNQARRDINKHTIHRRAVESMSISSKSKFGVAARL